MHVTAGAVKSYNLLKSEALKPRLAHAARAYPGFHGMKRLGVFLFPLDGMLVLSQVTPPQFVTVGFPSNSPAPIYTPGWREAL